MMRGEPVVETCDRDFEAKEAAPPAKTKRPHCVRQK